MDREIVLCEEFGVLRFALRQIKFAEEFNRGYRVNVNGHGVYSIRISDNLDFEGQFPVFPYYAQRFKQDVRKRKSATEQRIRALEIEVAKIMAQLAAKN